MISYFHCYIAISWDIAAQVLMTPRPGTPKMDGSQLDSEEGRMQRVQCRGCMGHWVKVKAAQSGPTLCDPRTYGPWNYPGQNSGVGCLFLLQGIFPTQRSNPSLPHCKQILYHLSHQGSPRILGWVAYPFSRGSSWPRNQTGVSCIACRFFTSWATREAPGIIKGEWQKVSPENSSEYTNDAWDGNPKGKVYVSWGHWEIGAHAQRSKLEYSY